MEGSEHRGVPYFGAFITRILLGVPYFRKPPHMEESDLLGRFRAYIGVQGLNWGSALRVVGVRLRLTTGALIDGLDTSFGRFESLG